MASILTRYLDAEALNRLSGRTIEPQGLALGNLAGGHRSPLAGFAVEFAGHREYVIGDDPRHVDWRLYYTRDKLFIKQYEMETNFVCHLVLDVSASMKYGEGEANKLSYAAKLATTLAYAIIRQNDKVSLATADEALRGFIPPGHTLAQMHRMVEHLNAVAPERTTRLSEALIELAGRSGRRAIVMVFSDLFAEPDELEPALQQLRFRDHEVVLFRVLHPDEREFRLDGMTKFLGLEAEGEELAQAEDIRAGYLAALAEQTTALQEVCRRNRVELVDVDSGRPAAESLVDYLDRRSRLHRR
ncbi:MAG: DUF58 domain-containing protein [Planctomycetota bacterium]|nr:DUF58 domain-containing protein [Planctomycetaceae bacterium]MDQ3329639.1 DUF58 domain-containing protein [Planctomycetota bacterium]